jgi:hypothetical protein
MSDDYAVGNFAAREALKELGVSNVPASDFDDAACTRQALYATERIVDLVEQFAERKGCRVLYVLSYSADRVRRYVRDGIRFDRPLVEYFDNRKLPYVDLLEAHAAELRTLGADLDASLKRHYIGHYSPLGNFFCAFAIKDRLVQLLDPPPPAYAKGG